LTGRLRAGTTRSPRPIGRTVADISGMESAPAHPTANQQAKMSQSNSPGGHDGVPTRPPSRAGTILGLVLLVAAGLGVYFLASRSVGLRAQEPPLRDAPVFFTVDGARITVPSASPLRNKLGIAEIADKKIQRSLTLPAVVEADPARTVKVLPPVAGRVIDLRVQLGARVAEGDVLAVIESSDLAQAISDLEKARSALTLTKQTLDRLLVLEKSRAISVKDREQAQSDYAQAQSEFARSQSRLQAIGAPADQKGDPRLLSMKAPVAGTVVDLQMAPGAFLNDPTAEVMTIADLSTVWVTANVPEKDTSLVAKDQSVDIVFTAYPNEVFKGNVLFVSDVLDPDTRRTKVRIAFANPNMRLKPNMFANATFLAPEQTMPVVPTTALVLRNESDQVFVEVAPWVFEARPIEIAFQQGNEVIVARGLKAGERVVVKGGVLLND
jgi:cobalt-zinc-cadmium efflux system membrane fusion protein